ncbi:DEAD/DEAH box helicase [Bacteriovorax sp. Seq25_V]|uniref:DEAD/DEAH box helicase n=1 Tax=Bacteriovorax sp. Seq25_V TaxID=1201288 RepID=UPI00038A2A0F|nr:DEAD/DEAH box helicase [Bacteriovorax sp. Seq25_V]EQC44668.1 SNF2 family N-terminal domain protein [Bacteriovorax sp. Seq25_V]
MDGFLIATGIVKDNKTHESKIVYKKRLEGTEEGPLSTNCDCTEWHEGTHCQHTAAIFLHYQSMKGTKQDDGSILPFVGTTGVHPTKYSTIINGPNDLENTPLSPMYSTLRYTLTTKKTIDFPIPQNFTGKIIINICPNKEFSTDFQDDVKQSVKYYFKLDDKIYKKISILENLYLFNWETGDAYFLTSDIKEFFSTVRANIYTLSIDDLLNLSLDSRCADKFEYQIEDQEIDFKEIEEPQLRVYISTSDRKGYSNFAFDYYNKKENRTRPPLFLTQLTFDGGSLDIFRKKSESYSFLQEVASFFEIESDSYKKVLSGKSKKNMWIRAISNLADRDYTLTFDHENKSLYKYENNLQKLIFNLMVNNFGEQFFRYSYYYKDTNELIYQVSMNTIVTGLSKFYTATAPYGVQVFYNKAELSSWSSRIRFERKQIGRSGWFDLELEISEDDMEILNNADIENNIAITKNGVVLLTQEQKDLLKFVTKYTKLETKEEINEGRFKKFILPFNRARVFELFELKKLGLEGALTPEEIELCERLQNLETMPQYDMPAEFNAELRPYQKTGYNWLRFLYENKLGACLADDMGLGKTIQTICFLQSIQDKIGRVLIVCPVSILLNWENEFKKFSNMDVHIFHGMNREIPKDKKVILTSYGILKKELDTFFEEENFDVFIMDEVQHLKNIRSLGAYSARKIKADFRICLTGTPVENDLAEFFNILDLAIPGLWGDLRFLRSTSTPKSRVFARKTSAPFILRRTKNQVLTDLPPKIENNVYLGFNDQEQNFYTDKLKSIKSKITNSPKQKKYGEILKGLLELRQSCLWQSHDNNSTRHYKHLESTKIEFLMENIEQILEEGHQAIIFSQFTTYLDIIETAFNEKCWKYSRIDGSQSVKKRQKSVDAFQSGETPLFLISLKAGGVGLNLTAASYVFIMDPWWNPAVESQAIDRAYRIGQQNKLTVFRPIIKGTVEEKVLKLQDMKRELFKELLPDDDESLFTGKLTMKDFEDLFN